MRDRTSYSVRSTRTVPKVRWFEIVRVVQVNSKRGKLKAGQENCSSFDL